ncbi:MAG: hypothetical protein M9894_33240 [Planctomycetes bacterium]|nr:hypothetical protein [Planctomycetota bacterium]
MTSPEDLLRLLGRGRRVSLSDGGISGMGTVVAISPGVYEVSVATHEDEGWAARWCRLTRVR